MRTKITVVSNGENKMEFTPEKIEIIRLEAISSWEDNDKEGELKNWIISAACSEALQLVLTHEFPDFKDYQGSTPYVDQWYLSKDGKSVEITNVLHGNAFTEQDVDSMAKTASEIATKYLAELIVYMVK